MHHLWAHRYQLCSASTFSWQLFQSNIRNKPFPDSNTNPSSTFKLWSQLLPQKPSVVRAIRLRWETEEWNMTLSHKLLRFRALSWPSSSRCLLSNSSQSLIRNSHFCRTSKLKRTEVLTTRLSNITHYFRAFFSSLPYFPDFYFEFPYLQLNVQQKLKLQVKREGAANKLRCRAAF